MKPDQRIAIGVPKVAMGVEVLDRVRFMLAHSPHKLASNVWLEPDMVENTKTKIRFNNGSSIFIFPYSSPHSLRGQTLSTLIFQDAAFIPYAHDKEYLASLGVFFGASKANIIMTSTPRYTEGLFYTMWQNAEQDKGTRLTIDYSLHPERDEAWADMFRKSMSEEAFKNEFECQFITKS
jgi:hypothetical protein